MPMKNPVHPGRSIRTACLEPLGLSVTEGAKVLGVTRQALNNVVNGKAGISPEMAIRLAKAFGSTAETWLRMQLAYDLAAARKDASEIKVRRQYLEEVHASCARPFERPGTVSAWLIVPPTTGRKLKRQRLKNPPVFGHLVYGRRGYGWVIAGMLYGHPSLGENTHLG